MKTIIIDHEKYGCRSEFPSIEEAESCIRQCGSDFADVKLRVNSVGVYDQDGDYVGEEK